MKYQNYFSSWGKLLFVADSRQRAAEVRPPKKTASTASDSFYDTQNDKTGKKKWDDDNRAHYFFTSEQEQPNVSHLLLPFWILAWQCAGSASMLHSSLPQKEDGDPNTEPRCPARCPACCPDNTRRSPAFNKSQPKPSLCLSETLDPLRACGTTASIPSHGPHDFTHTVKSLSQRI